MGTEPNELLRTARKAAGLTQGQLAELANTQVEAVGHCPGAMDADYIGKLERGVHRWPNRHYRNALRAVLRAGTDADLGFFSTRSRVATVTNGFPSEIGEDDVERKTFLRVLAGSVAGLALSDPLGEFVANAATTGPARRVGQADAEQVRHLARMFASQDHLYGGRLSAKGVVAQLSTTADLLHGSFMSTTARQQYFSAVADLADVAAGISFDAGHHREAERCFRFAVGCATEAADWPVRAKALSGLANLAVHQNRPDDALSYAELALVRADRLSPLVRSVIHTRHARALGAAQSDREGDCLAAIDQAELHFTNRTGDEPAWLAYYDRARFDRDTGRALLGLALNGGSYTQAQQQLSAAIERFPAGNTRGKVLAMTNLATVTMARDDPERAAELGNQALDAVGSVRSDRVFEAFRQLRSAGSQHRRTRSVRELNHRIRLLLQSTTA